MENLLVLVSAPQMRVLESADKWMAAADKMAAAEIAGHSCQGSMPSADPIHVLPRPEARAQVQCHQRPTPGAPVHATQARIDLYAPEAEQACGGPRQPSDSGAVLAKLLASVLDEVDYGLVLIAADGRVVHANHAAQVELGPTKSIHLSNRRLICRSGVDQRALAAARDGGRRRMLAFASDDVAAEGKSCDLSIVPLSTSLTTNQSGHAVLVALARNHIAETLSFDAYARELGLSRREQQVLAALCQGRRAKDIAAQLEIGEETVRSYLKQLKTKTRCAGIFDMINQVSRLPPMVSALRYKILPAGRLDEPFARELRPHVHQT